MEFTTPKQMKKAERELNGAELSGRGLKVDVATPRGDGERGGGGTPRGRGRGRFCFRSYSLDLFQIIRFPWFPWYYVTLD